MPLKRSILALRVVRRQPTAPFWDASVWMVLSALGSKYLSTIMGIFSLTAWNAWSCSGPYKNAISFLSAHWRVQWLLPAGLSTSSGCSLSPGSSVDSWRNLGIPWQVWLSLSFCLACHLRVSRGGRRNSLHHSLTVAHPKPARPPKMPGVNKFLSFYSIILKLGTKKKLVIL